MDYIRQMKSFRERRKSNPISANAVALYLLLFEEANEQRFPESFQIRNSSLQEEISLYDREFRRAREELAREGYITYGKGSKRAYTLYSLADFSAVSLPESCRELAGKPADNPPESVREMSAKIVDNQAVSAELQNEIRREPADNPPESVREPAVSCPQTCLEEGGPTLSIYNYNYNYKHNCKQDPPSIPPEGSGETLDGSEEPAKKTAVDVIMERFSRFWAAYPKKQGKGDAEKAWKKIKPSEALTNQMLEALELAKKSSQWTRDNGQYIPGPGRWLREKRWEDDYPKAKTADSQLKFMSDPEIPDF